MKWNRGFFRVWVLLTGVWCLLVVTLIIGGNGLWSQSGLVILILPPALLYAFGLAVGWVASGFSSIPTAEADLDPFSKPVSITLFSSYPILLFLQQKAPFSEWEHPEIEVSAEIRNFCQFVVWIYQFETYGQMVRLRLGADVANVVRADQTRRLNKMPDKLGDTLALNLDAFDVTIAEVKELIVATGSLEGSDTRNSLPPPLETGLAFRLLARHPDSPFHQAAESDPTVHKSEAFELAYYQLAKCLEYGRIRAQIAFEPFLTHAKLE